MNELFDAYTRFHRVANDGTVHTTSTASVVVQEDAHSQLATLLKREGISGPIAVVFDATTFRIAGEEVVAKLRDARFETQHFMLVERDGESALVCDDERIAELTDRLERSTCTHTVSVGAGTINDVAKMASFQCGQPYSTVATAPSMNGYTSSIAAILSNGVKTTQPCHAPLIAVARPSVMAAAPERMIASGLGDLYSKPVSNADWRLSHRLLGTFHSDIVMEIVEAGSALLDGVAPRLAARDPEAVAQLTGAIMLSGLAMQAAGTSGPASGGEHLVSHFIDMTSIAFGESHDFHGCQVAVGTVATSALYAEVSKLDPTTIDVDALVARYPDWDDYEPVLRERFGKLADAVIPFARKSAPAKHALRERLQTLVENWHDIMSDVGQTLRPTHELEAELSAAKCPTTFAAIDVTHDRALRALTHSKDIRARYTILHLAFELGLLDDFAERYCKEQFAAASH
jgi:glycerol-1-phosphate dehydrogenase [NAD(P)+]